ncbi:bifunctional RNase H/acid phosphatase [Streptomyces sp. NBC_00555]|uniref:bifunctional RNase H/acid phosphatase n=1 Tax=unclassified Streptomyces TaxID=2593676 RepID=UPI0022514A50|nr:MULTISPECIES: bifunctional RNase H/acid phosphatase [unclassified Streptomyces]MCX5014181.1 bifunctional RNase H/acid phosphatase [Streptomyces sp. NBC_00555]MCX5608195.1 bifunctional RNase H/acid phosphatase [Streptomyces sp. NBC_00047]
MPQFVVEADGGSRGNPGPAGYGSVVLDPATGETLAERAEYIGVATNNVAEYKGLIAGLKAARELAPDAQVLVRMDSKLVVEQMSGRWKIKHPDMKPLAAEAAKILPRAQVTYQWIPREKNKHADRLANEAMDAGKRGKQWEPSASSAALDHGAARAVASGGVPGDAAKGAAAVRAALASGGGTGTGAAEAADTRAARSTGSAEAGGTGTLFGEAGALAPGRAPALAGRVPAPAAGSGSAVEDAAPEAGRTRTTAGGQGWGPDMGTPATFVLLRHGETALTPQKRFSGSGGSDPELSPAGRRQASAVAEALAARGTVQTVISSPLRRCRETAQAVADRLGLTVTVEEGLREVDFGAWEGLTFAEVRERFPDDLQAWLDSPRAAPTGGGESFTTATRRISATRDRLLAEHAGRTVLLVSHVTPVKILVRLALGAPPESLFRMELSAASLSAVAYYADGNASVRLLNDTSHLR